ncbi:uncharacterized protein LOC129592052 [Paramacrobiotus metropolitanus]|uniref:uncharacterized protein LOC129592052 n=1 Tax=Paramacrobiotus metropolitanus TaxID=2943436 RepID=UPI002445CBCC|nr:uncharacterized protein LOC129592052 [Paramacrobiotus metropolitanus]
MWGEDQGRQKMDFGCQKVGAGVTGGCLDDIAVAASVPKAHCRASNEQGLAGCGNEKEFSLVMVSSNKDHQCGKKRRTLDLHLVLCKNVDETGIAWENLLSEMMTTSLFPGTCQLGRIIWVTSIFWNILLTFCRWT